MIHGIPARAGSLVAEAVAVGIDAQLAVDGQGAGVGQGTELRVHHGAEQRGGEHIKGAGAHFQRHKETVAGVAYGTGGDQARTGQLGAVLFHQLLVLGNTAGGQDHALGVEGDDGILGLGDRAHHGAGVVGDQRGALGVDHKLNALFLAGIHQHVDQAGTAAIGQRHGIAGGSGVGSGVKLNPVGNHPVNGLAGIGQHAVQTLLIRVAAVHAAVGHSLFPVGLDGLHAVGLQTVVGKQLGINAHQNAAGQVGGAAGGGHLVDDHHVRAVFLGGHGGGQAGDAGADHQYVGGLLYGGLFCLGLVGLRGGLVGGRVHARSGQRRFHGLQNAVAGQRGASHGVHGQAVGGHDGGGYPFHSGIADAGVVAVLGHFHVSDHARVIQRHGHLDGTFTVLAGAHAGIGAGLCQSRHSGHGGQQAHGQQKGNASFHRCFTPFKE